MEGLLHKVFSLFVQTLFYRKAIFEIRMDPTFLSSGGVHQIVEQLLAGIVIGLPLFVNRVCLTF